VPAAGWVVFCCVSVVEGVRKTGLLLNHFFHFFLLYYVWCADST
jgi:hypothetical protein